MSVPSGNDIFSGSRVNLEHMLLSQHWWKISAMTTFFAHLEVRDKTFEAGDAFS